MRAKGLSILIPARNEMFLSLTVEDVLKNIEGDTEVIVVLDGVWANPPLKEDPRLTVIYHNQSVGQRAATNEACRLSQAKYVMKVDAHCGFDKGFDVKMMAEMHDDWTMLPAMYNFHVYNWVCIGNNPRSGKSYLTEAEPRPQGCGYSMYMAPTQACHKCKGNMERVLVWKRRENRRNEFYRFDKTMHFQYWGAFKKRPEALPDVAPVLSAQGSCFMLTREKYWELDICDEKHGSWGQQGTEVACKTWLSGGQLMLNKKTWYAHMFRTQGKDFGFPYPNPESKISLAREYSRDLWLNDKWPKAKYTLKWLLDKFYPVPDWHDEIKPSKLIVQPSTEAKKPTKGILYFTDFNLDEKILLACQKTLLNSGLPIVSVTLKPTNFGKNVVLPLERGMMTLFKQILVGLEILDTDFVFPVDHDTLYHPSHFEFTPPRRDVYYYNLNEWRVRATDGHALHYDAKNHHALCCDRKLLLTHYRERIRRVELEGGWSRRMGFEPGSHNRKERIDNFGSDIWWSKRPNIDVRHDKNMTASRWRKDQFRSQRNCQNWIESDSVPGWGVTKGRFNKILERVIND